MKRKEEFDLEIVGGNLFDEIITTATQEADIDESDDENDDFGIYDESEDLSDVIDEDNIEVVPLGTADLSDLSDGFIMDENGDIYDKKGKKKGKWKKYAKFLVPGLGEAGLLKKASKWISTKAGKKASSKKLVKAVQARNKENANSKGVMPILAPVTDKDAIATIFGLGWLKKVVEKFAETKRFIVPMYGVDRIAVTVGVLLHRYTTVKDIRNKAEQVALGSTGKSVVSVVAAGGAATAPATAADGYWGGIVCFTDSPVSADFRPVTIVMTGTGMDTFTVVVWPKKHRFLFAYLAGQQDQGVLSIARATTMTATVADGGMRAGAVLTHEGLNERDLGGLVA